MQKDRCTLNFARKSLLLSDDFFMNPITEIIDAKDTIIKIPAMFLTDKSIWHDGNPF